MQIDLTPRERGLLSAALDTRIKILSRQLNEPMYDPEFQRDDYREMSEERLELFGLQEKLRR